MAQVDMTSGYYAFASFQDADDIYRGFISFFFANTTLLDSLRPQLVYTG